MRTLARSMVVSRVLMGGNILILNGNMNRQYEHVGHTYTSTLAMRSKHVPVSSTSGPSCLKVLQAMNLASSDRMH